MAHRLLAVIAIVLLLAPTVTAERANEEVRLEAATASVVFHLRVALTGPEARDARESIDVTAGNGNGVVEASEVRTFVDARPRGVTSACLPALSFLRLGGAVPEAVEATEEVLGAEGSVDERTMWLRYRYVLRYPDPGVPSVDLHFSWSAFERMAVLSNCGYAGEMPPCDPLVPLGECTNEAPARAKIHAAAAIGHRWQRERAPDWTAHRWDHDVLVLDEETDGTWLSNGPLRLGIERLPEAVETAPAGASDGRWWWALLAAPVLFVAWRRGLVHRAWAALTAFTRVERGDALSKERRRRILEALAQRPGRTLADLKRATGGSHGATLHHLAILSRLGLVRHVQEGRRRRYYLSQGPAPGPYVSDFRARLLACVAERPGLTLDELAAHLGSRKPNLWYHGRQLERLGLLQIERNGRLRLYPITPK